MGAVRVDLPEALVNSVRQEMAPDDELDGVVSTAVEIWLGNRRQQKAERENQDRILRQAGLMMAPESQRALAESIMSLLPEGAIPSRSRVEAALGQLRKPLSEELLDMRGER